MYFLAFFRSAFRTLSSIYAGAFFRSFSGPYFSVFGLITERYSVPLYNQFKCGKIRTRKTPNMSLFTQCYFRNKTLHPYVWKHRVLSTLLFINYKSLFLQKYGHLMGHQFFFFGNIYDKLIRLLKVGLLNEIFLEMSDVHKIVR